MIWKEIIGIQGCLISEYGDVISPKGTMLKSYLDKNGYKKYSIKKDGKTLNRVAHRLVAIAFCEGDKTLSVNHIDGNKSNNHFSNLEFVTIKENIRHAYRVGLITPQKTGAKNPRSKKILAVKDCAIIEFTGVRYAARTLGLHQANIQATLRNSKRTTGGFKFYYL